jgi:hypothetical protein
MENWTLKIDVTDVAMDEIATSVRRHMQTTVGLVSVAVRSENERLILHVCGQFDRVVAWLFDFECYSAEGVMDRLNDARDTGMLCLTESYNDLV